MDEVFASAERLRLWASANPIMRDHWLTALLRDIANVLIERDKLRSALRRTTDDIVAMLQHNLEHLECEDCPVHEQMAQVRINNLLLGKGDDQR